MPLHFFLQLAQNDRLFATKETHGVFRILSIALFANQIHTWATATVDLVKQAGTRPVFENAVFTGSQTEYPLKDLDRLPDSP